MKNEALTEVGDALVGDWTMTMTDAWFLDSPDIKVSGDASIAWLGDAFLELRGSLGMDHGSWHWIIGRNDARAQLVNAYGVSVVLATTSRNPPLLSPRARNVKL
jgi:hypothetical protein